MPCYYLPELSPGQKKATLTGDELHHLFHVMRKPVGTRILLTNGNGVLAEATIESIGKKKAELVIDSLEEKVASEPRIAIAFSLLRNKHDHMIVEKLTELGFKDFFPFLGDYTVRKDSGNAAGKFEAVVITAIKQCDGAFLPRIHPVKDFRQQLDAVRASGYKILLASEWEKKANLLTLVDGRENICLVIGPEGGFSEDEKNWILEQGITTFSLGNHIVRAETAAISAGGQLTGILLAKDSEFY